MSNFVEVPELSIWLGRGGEEREGREGPGGQDKQVWTGLEILGMPAGGRGGVSLWAFQAEQVDKDPSPPPLQRAAVHLLCPFPTLQAGHTLPWLPSATPPPICCLTLPGQSWRGGREEFPDRKALSHCGHIWSQILIPSWKGQEGRGLLPASPPGQAWPLPAVRGQAGGGQPGMSTTSPCWALSPTLGCDCPWCPAQPWHISTIPCRSQVRGSQRRGGHRSPELES